MKKVFWTGLVMVAVVLFSCSNKQLENGKVAIRIDGEKYVVPAETVEKFTESDIKLAWDRYNYLQENNIKPPKDASEFGLKLFELYWKAVDRNCKVIGLVTVVHYEKGVEVVKDGKSWFYDFKNFVMVSPRRFEFYAMESVMQPGVWEPVVAGTDVISGKNFFVFDYSYTGIVNGEIGEMELCFVPEEIYKSNGFNNIEELRADPVNYRNDWVR